MAGTSKKPRAECSGFKWWNRGYRGQTLQFMAGALSEIPGRLSRNPLEVAILEIYSAFFWFPYNGNLS